MPSLIDIPGYGAYIQRNAQNRQAELGDLQQSSGLMGILKNIQAQQREAQFRGELAGLGAEATPEQRLSVATKYAGPEGIQKLAEHQITAREGIAARKEVALEAAKARRETAEANINLRYDMLGQRAIDEESKRTIQERRNADLKAIADRHDQTVRLIGQTRADATQEAAATRAAIAANKPMTEFQGKAALYGTRAAQSDKVLKALEDKVNLYGLSAGQATGIAGNALMTSEQRRISQAQRDFVNAVLRQESGAVISDQEFANAKQQYFPAPGDDKNTLDQKRANRQLAIQGFSRMAGPVGARDIQAILDNPLLPGVDPTAETPQQNKAGAGWKVTPVK